MGLPSVSWVLPTPEARECPAAASESPVAAALGRCRPLYRRSALVVAPSQGSGWEAMRFAKQQGACVTVLCPAEQATDAKAAGADAILDPARTDPTWYRGAWSVIVDLADLPEPIWREIFRADTTKLPAFSGAEDPKLGFQLIRITGVQQPETVAEDVRRASAEQMKRLIAQEQLTDYVDGLKRRIEVKVKPDLIEKK